MAKTTRRTTTKAGKTTRKKGASKSSSRKTTTASKKKSARTATKVSRAKAGSTKKKTKAKTKTKTKKSTRVTKKSPTTKKKVTTSGSKKVSKAASSKKTTSKKSKVETKAVESSKKKRKTVSKVSKKPKSVAEAASAVTADEKGYVFINGRRVRMISTRGITPTKKPRPAAPEPVVEEDTGPTKPLKTRLSKKELNHYRNLLLIKRAEIIGDLDAMEASALRSSGGDISHMPIHMADIGTDTYDQDFTLGLAEAERKQLREIDDALQRIEDKTYGVCFMTGNEIPKTRLDAKPWAKYTIEAARVVESQSGDFR